MNLNCLKKADEDEIKNILLNAIEIHYGSISKAIERPNNLITKALCDIRNIVNETLDKET